MTEQRSAWDTVKVIVFILFLLATLGRVMNYNRAQQRMVDSQATAEIAVPLTAEAILAGTPLAPIR